MQSVSFRAEQQQAKAIESVEEMGLADNESEAARLLINQGAADLGVMNGAGTTASAERRRLKRVLQDLSELVAYVGLAWGLVLMLYPHSEVQWMVVAPIMLALTVIVSKNMFVRHG